MSSSWQRLENAKLESGLVKPGRPTVLTEETKAIILENVREGAPFVTAAAMARVSPDSISNWIKLAKAEGEGSQYWEFYMDLRQAQAQAQLEHIQELKKAIKKSPMAWTTRAWLLERIDPDNYAQRPIRIEQEITVKQEFPGIKKLSLEELDALDKIMQKLERGESSSDVIDLPADSYQIIDSINQKLINGAGTNGSLEEMMIKEPGTHGAGSLDFSGMEF